MRGLWSAFLVALVACGGTHEGAPAEGRGSAACRIWQDSVCDWADRCGALTREDCDAEFQGVTCRSDGIAMKCSAEFEDASCRGIPMGCGIDDVADPAPAAKACDRLTNLICERSVECGISATQGDCLNEGAVDCSRSVAFKLGFEKCVDRVEALDCEVMVVPPICESVIIAKP